MVEGFIDDFETGEKGVEVEENLPFLCERFCAIHWLGFDHFNFFLSLLSLDHISYVFP